MVLGLRGWRVGLLQHVILVLASSGGVQGNHAPTSEKLHVLLHKVCSNHTYGHEEKETI